MLPDPVHLSHMSGYCPSHEQRSSLCPTTYYTRSTHTALVAFSRHPLVFAWSGPADEALLKNKGFNDLLRNLTLVCFSCLRKYRQKQEPQTRRIGKEQLF